MQMHAHRRLLCVDIGAHAGLVTKPVCHRIFDAQRGKVEALERTVLRGHIDDLKVKLRYLAVTVLHAPPGQASYHLARNPICFHIPIDELAKRLRFLAIPAFLSMNYRKS